MDISEYIKQMEDNLRGVDKVLDEYQLVDPPELYERPAVLY